MPLKKWLNAEFRKESYLFFWRQSSSLNLAPVGTKPFLRTTPSWPLEFISCTQLADKAGDLGDGSPQRDPGPEP